MIYEVKHKEYLEKLVDALRKIIVPGQEEEEYGAQKEHQDSYAVKVEKGAPEIGKRRL